MPTNLLNDLPLIAGGLIGAVALLLIVFKSLHSIGATEVGLINKRFSFKSGKAGGPIAFNGEAGYQAELLRAGLRFRLWPLYSVTKHPFVQVPADGIGVVVAQVGETPANGAKSAVYKPGFGSFEDLEVFIKNGGQQGVQRPVLLPGRVVVLHPVAFLVRTRDKVYGQPVSSEASKLLNLEGIGSDKFNLVHIKPMKDEEGKMIEMAGIVTALDGLPLESGDLACRLGGFVDVAKLEKDGGATNAQLVEASLSSQNEKHNNYQDFQAFIDVGGRIGLQHDPLMAGEYTLNPYLVRVVDVPMLSVKQGEVAVITSYVGLPTVDTSGPEFKHGFIVNPGHRGIWNEPIRTNKIALNPRCYRHEIVATQILTLNWAEATSAAHNLDKNLKTIVAKSKEGFEFSIDLQVQIHVPDIKAPMVISRVGSMHNLVNEVLQAAVGNYFRDTLQSMEAVDFIQKRRQVQEQATIYIREQLSLYHIETVGVFIQDVDFPDELVKVLKEREIAKQEIETYKQQQLAEKERIQMELTKGKANAQAGLAKSEVEIAVRKNEADARVEQARGEAEYLNKVGGAKGAEIRAIGEAKAEGYSKQVAALGQNGTAIVNALEAISRSNSRLVPDVLVAGGGNGGALDGLAAVLMGQIRSGNLLGGTKEIGEAAPSLANKPAVGGTMLPAPTRQKDGVPAPSGNGGTVT